MNNGVGLQVLTTLIKALPLQYQIPQDMENNTQRYCTNTYCERMNISEA